MNRTLRAYELLVIVVTTVVVALAAACAGPESPAKLATNAVNLEPLSFSFRQIPAGELETGGPGSLNPRRHFPVDAFWLATTPVTNADYERFDPGHRHRRGDVSTNDDSPVTNVTYQDALRYCAWLSARLGVAARLPTSLEWEWACYGGGGGPYSFGQIPLFTRQSKWARLLSRTAVPVRRYPANGYGVFDMTGNVQELCGDRYVTDAHDVRRFPGDADYASLLEHSPTDFVAVKNCSAHMPSLTGCECSKLYVASMSFPNPTVSFRIALSRVAGR